MKIKEVVVRFYEQRQGYREHLGVFDNQKKYFEKCIDKYFEAKGITQKEFVYDEGLLPKKILVQQRKRKQITFFPDKLEKALPKDVAKKVVCKTYTINNMDAFISLLKEYDVPYKKVKPLITVDKAVDTNALDNAYDLGLFEKEDIEGCYSLFVGNPYYVMTEKA